MDGLLPEFLFQFLQISLIERKGDISAIVLSVYFRFLECLSVVLSVVLLAESGDHTAVEFYTGTASGYISSSLTPCDVDLVLSFVM